jgi:predicted nucleic acid-binding protein
VARRNVRSRRPPTHRARRTRTRAGETVSVVFRYIETSALLAALLEGDTDARAAIDAPGRRVTSALTLAEAYRAIVRGRTAGRLTSEDERAALTALQTFGRRVDIAAVTDAVLARVGRPFPMEPIRTLDAIHLATAELLGDPPPLMVVVTRDARVRDNARALGYVVD